MSRFVRELVVNVTEMDNGGQADAESFESQPDCPVAMVSGGRVSGLSWAAATGEHGAWRTVSTRRRRNSPLVPMSTATRECLIHGGMPKTGTTSIQASLCRGLDDARFRLLTLDSYFGNLLIGSAFSGDYGVGSRFISHGVTEAMVATVPRELRDYLDRALAAAGRRGCLPILSAEIISNLPESALEGLRDFVVERNWQPRVVMYVRSPLDYLESWFQQRLKAGVMVSGVPKRIADCLDASIGPGYARPLRAVDHVFGREHVEMFAYDQAGFPGGCVVRHFCGIAGIPGDSVRVIRENDSVSLDAVRFLFALSEAGRRGFRTRADRVHRAVLVRRLLEELPGEKLRFHDEVAGRYREAIREDLAWVEDRLGCEMPLSRRGRTGDGGIRCDADLLDFRQESLEWLAAASGRRVVKRGQGAETVRAVVEQLESTRMMVSPRHFIRECRERAGELWWRALLKRRNQR